MNIPTGEKVWKKFETYNKIITLDVLFLANNSGLQKIRPAIISKYNLELEHQTILEMNTKCKKWHYLAVKSLSRLLHKITLNHNDNHYCMNYLHSFRAKNKLKSLVNVCKNNICNVKIAWKNL